MKKNSKTIRKTNVTLPAGTVELLCEMFTSDNGVDMSNIIDDLAVDTNRGLVAINLGLLLKGKVLQLPNVKYSTSNHNKYVCVNVLEGNSLLKDIVTYTQYRYDFNEEKQCYEKYDYTYREQCSVADWFDKLDELPEGIQLPELVDKD